jgi:hypothetical protein
MRAQRDIPVILDGPYNSGILAGGSTALGSVAIPSVTPTIAAVIPGIRNREEALAARG